MLLWLYYVCFLISGVVIGVIIEELLLHRELNVLEVVRDNLKKENNDLIELLIKYEFKIRSYEHENMNLLNRNKYLKRME